MSKTKETKQDKEDSKDAGQVALKKAMDSNKDSHFNNIPPLNYKISTGSLSFDLETGGGIPNSVVRFAGMAEAGKTSSALNIARIFLEAPNHRAVYFLSDKELSDNLLKRCGIKFVDNIDDWVDGTCYIIRTNVYEMVCNTINNLIKDRSQSKQFLFILDSMDFLAPKSALEVEDFAEAKQKGGTGAITAHFFQCFSILLPRLGHAVIMISQHRDIINIKGPPIIKQMSTSGGRAAEHAATWAFEFSLAQNSKEDMYWEGEPYKSKKLGHNCIVKFKKSTNEKTGSTVRYPVLYGRVGSSIWIEKEIYDMLLFWGQVKLKSSWLEFNPNILKEIHAINKDFPEKVQGEEKCVKLLEANPDVSKFLYEKFKVLSQ